jgi:hypothetical protein
VTRPDRHIVFFWPRQEEECAMTKLEFCEHFIYLKGRLISFAGRPYLIAPYQSPSRRLVIRASRQVEKTTFLVNTILHTAVSRPGSHIIFVCPRLEQARVFSNSRLLPTIYESPVIQRVLLGRRKSKLQVMNLHFANRSKVYIRAAFHSADPVRGIDGDLLLADEFQDIASGHLPVLEETLSHSELGTAAGGADGNTQKHRQPPGKLLPPIVGL